MHEDGALITDPKAEAEETEAKTETETACDKEPDCHGKFTFSRSSPYMSKTGTGTEKETEKSMHYAMIKSQHTL